MKKRWLTYMMLMAGAMPLLTAGCSEETEPLLHEPASQLHLAARTRAGDADQNELSSVHVFIARATPAEGLPEYTEGDFFRNGDTWTSTAGVSQQNYYIYGYAPSGIGTCSISKLDGQSTYEPGAVLTFTEMDPISDSDVGFVEGVLGTTTKEATIGVGYDDITSGNYLFVGQPEGQNYICLKLSHLYAAITIHAKVHADYTDLRTIKIRKMVLYSDYKKPNATVTLLKDVGIKSIEWSGDFDNDASSVETRKTIYENSEGIELIVGEAKRIGSGYLIPNQKVKLITTYDIYDKKGNLVRYNCTASNLIDMTTESRLKKVEAGEKLNLTLTVNPSYVYQLSEPDPETEPAP